MSVQKTVQNLPSSTALSHMYMIMHTCTLLSSPLEVTPSPCSASDITPLPCITVHVALFSCYAADITPLACFVDLFVMICHVSDGNGEKLPDFTTHRHNIRNIPDTRSGTLTPLLYTDHLT